jgi:ring-1,2-phenylacetyl-CoA epoxidase subunit PaaD
VVTGAAAGQVWQWLAQVPDPEIPVISIVDLGIVRDVAFAADGACVVTITPTYSGCPAMAAIAGGIRETLAQHGIERCRLETRLVPAWTTDWIGDAARARLRDYGIAPPGQQAPGYRNVDIGSLARRGDGPPAPCPRCGSDNTRPVSQFGSTSCKALYACRDCREPFDHFKPH